MDESVRNWPLTQLTSQNGGIQEKCTEAEKLVVFTLCFRGGCSRCDSGRLHRFHAGPGKGKSENKTRDRTLGCTVL